MSEAWDEISKWLEAHLPKALENLRPPASEAAIEDAERALGVSFPSELKDLYRLHDGEENNWPPCAFDNAHWFMPLSMVLEHKQSMSEFAELHPTDSFDSWRSSVEDHVISIKGSVKPLICSQYWIPLSTMNGDVHRYVDFDPAPGGVQGQVIEIDPESCSHKVLANSFDEFLSEYAEGLRTGRYILDDDCIVDTREDASEDWGIPEYLKGIKYEYITAADISQPINLNQLKSNEKVEIVGQMEHLLATSNKIQFSLLVSGGEEYSILATNEDTKGYGAVAIDQFAKVIAIKNDAPGDEFSKQFGRSQLLALEYKMVKGPDISLGKRPWWKLW